MRNPRELGSITPSSRFLTRAVADAIDVESATRIAELGPGTGVFTRALLERLGPDGSLVAVDTNLDFIELLRREIADPRFTAVHGSAEVLPAILAEHGLAEVDAVVSGIPYSLLPKPVTAGILRAARQSLAAGGRFVGYQYSPYLRPFLKSVFGNVRYRFVPLNVPPAFVYHSERRPAER